MASRWTRGSCLRAGLVGAVLLSIALIPVVIVGAEPSPTAVLTVRLTHPEVQGGRFIDLFKGSRAPHPAETGNLLLGLKLFDEMFFHAVNEGDQFQMELVSFPARK